MTDSDLRFASKEEEMVSISFENEEVPIPGAYSDLENKGSANSSDPRQLKKATFSLADHTSNEQVNTCQENVLGESRRLNNLDNGTNDNFATANPPDSVLILDNKETSLELRSGAASTCHETAKQERKAEVAKEENNSKIESEARNNYSDQATEMKEMSSISSFDKQIKARDNITGKDGLNGAAIATKEGESPDGNLTFEFETMDMPSSDDEQVDHHAQNVEAERCTKVDSEFEEEKKEDDQETVLGPGKEEAVGEESRDSSTLPGEIEHAPSDERAYLLEQQTVDDDEATRIVETASSKTKPVLSLWRTREEEELKRAKKSTDRRSFGSRYKNGLVNGLSLESNSGVTYSKTQMEQPYSGKNLQSRDGRRSIGSVQQIRSPSENTTATVSSNIKPSGMSSPSMNTRNLLKMYNKDLYYSNELNYLLDIDPAKPSSKGRMNIEQISIIVRECPSVCRKKFSLTFNGETLQLYPIFSLVSHQAPLELVEAVFTENPFRFHEERDKYDQTLMHYALRFNPPSIEMLNFLVHRSTHSLEIWDNQKRSPLHTACFFMSSASDVVLFVLEETPKYVLSIPDKDGNLPIHLAVESSQCSFSLIESLVEKCPEALAFRTVERDLPLDLARKQTLGDEIQGFILENTPRSEVGPSSLAVALRTAKYSRSLPLIQCLVEEDPTILLKNEGGGPLPIEIAYNHGASKVVVQYLYDKMPKQKIPKWMVKLRPTENEVQKSLKVENIEMKKAQDKDVDVPKTDVATVTNGIGATSPKVADLQARSSSPVEYSAIPCKPSFWELLCCKPRMVLE